MEPCDRYPHLTLRHSSGAGDFLTERCSGQRPLELFSAVAALGSHKIFILGDWNFAPDEFPIAS
eukprot:5364571-Amphidinium_carterae.6